MKNALILFVSRIIKIVANLLKLLCYVFHFLFPNKRFTLPRHTAPLFGRGRPLAIPKTVWQTNYTDRVTLPVYLNYLCNRLLTPGFEYRFMITEDRAEFIKANYPAEIYDSYSRIQIGAAQADFWRLLVLQKHGGVYLDIDAHFVWPLGRVIRPEHKELYLRIKSGEISNYFIASTPANPHLGQMIERIMNNIEDNRLNNVYELTGPGVLNQVLEHADVPTTYYRYTCNQGNFTNEHFQYIDKPQGKWTREQEKVDIIKR